MLLYRVKGDEIMKEVKAVKNKRSYIKIVAVCAVCIIVIVIGGRLFSRIDLPLSKGAVSARYVTNFPKVSSSHDLDWGTEEELFSKYKTTIFRGTIKDIKNIEINMRGNKTIEHDMCCGQAFL